MLALKGSCLCGEVAFQAEQPVKWCSNCHCSLCRRAHGAAFVTWFGVDEPSFRFASGKHSLRWFASSEDSERGFCSVCGSTLFFRSRRWPGEIHAVLANIHSEHQLMPAKDACFEDRVSWRLLTEELQQ